MADINYNPNDLVITATDDNANSATVTGYLHDLNISGLVKDGKVIEVYESQGGVTSVRKAARQFVGISFGKQLKGGIDAFNMLLNGLTAGFTSVTADIGDVDSVDLTLTWTAGGVPHSYVCEDCHSNGTTTADGNPVTDAFDFLCIGPVTRDGQTIISSR